MTDQVPECAYRIFLTKSGWHYEYSIIVVLDPLNDGGFLG